MDGTRTGPRRGELTSGGASTPVAGHSFDALTFRAPRGGAGWIDENRCEWTIVVGDRIRRLRRDRNLTLVQLARRVHKPGGGMFSPGHISKLERGWANAPISTYVAISDALDVAPWRLLGPEEVQKDVTEGELTLVQFLRHVALPPHEALARLAGHRAGTSEPPGSRPARAVGP